MENYNYEIIEALEEYYSDDIQTLLYCMKHLYTNTNEYDYQTKLEQLCADGGLCPICFSSLIYDIKHTNPTEYFGFPTTEPYYIRHCTNCGYKD
jgi:hypothetical protein